MDITALDIGDMVKASALDVPDNVSVVYDQDFVVVKVLKPRGGGAAAAEEATTETAGE